MKKFLSANKKIVIGAILAIIVIILAIIFFRAPQNQAPKITTVIYNQNLPTSISQNQAQNPNGPIIQGQNDNSIGTLPADSSSGDYLNSIFSGQTGNTPQNSQNSSPAVKSLQDIYAQMAPATQSQASNAPRMVALKKFGNDAGAIVNKYSVNALNINSLFTRSISTTTPVSQNDLDALANLGGNYKSIGAGISQLKAPSEIADLSLKLATNYSTMGDSLQKLAGSAVNGQIPAQNFQTYGQKAKDLNDSFFALMKYFRDNGVSFDKSEAGFMFMMEL